MLNQEELQKVYDKDGEKKKNINATADDFASKAINAIQKKVQQIKNKIIELIEKKRELLGLPLTKAETLEMAKTALRENRQLYLDELLAKHLSDCQTQNVDAPLSPRSISISYFGRDDYWKLIYGIITEESLEKAAKMLPDIGLPAAERDAKIKKIDEEIATLESQIEKELKKV